MALIDYFLLRDLAFFLLDIILVFSIPLVLAGTYRLLKRDSTEQIKREYERRIKDLKNEVKELREKIVWMRRQHDAELKNMLKRHRMLIGINRAIEAGSASLICTAHQSEVEVLVDGTLICREGGHKLDTAGREAVDHIQTSYEGEEEYEEEPV